MHLHTTLICLFIFGCGDVVTNETSSQAGGGHETHSMTGMGGETASSGSGGSGGNDSSSSSTIETCGDCWNQCAETDEPVSIFVETSEGTYGCGDDLLLGEIEIQGEVVGWESNPLTIQTCPSNGPDDCVPEVITASVDTASEELYPWIPDGTYVTLRAKFDQNWGCSSRIEITHLQNWNGYENPYNWVDDNMVWLAASEGIMDSTFDTQLTVTAVPYLTGCDSGSESCEYHDDYYWNFYPLENLYSAESINVYMGNTESLSLNSGYGVLYAHNGSSYSGNSCDDYFAWSWWAYTSIYLND